MSLVLEGVSKATNGQTHIHPTDLERQSGTMNVLLGPTSSGKTSLMRLMAGLDVPNRLWWKNIGDAMFGAKTPQEALDALCEDQEKVLIRLERAGVQGDLGPVMNDESDPSFLLDQPGSSKAKLADENETPVTIAYDEMIKSWQ